MYLDPHFWMLRNVVLLKVMFPKVVKHNRLLLMNLVIFHTLGAILHKKDPQKYDWMTGFYNISDPLWWMLQTAPKPFIRVWVLFHDIWCLRAGPRATGWLDWIGLWVFRKPHKVYGNWSRQRKMNNQRRPPESLFIAAQKHFISRSYPAVSQPPWVNPTLLVAARPTIGGGVGL